MRVPNPIGRVGTEDRAATTLQAAGGWRILVRVARASTRHRTTGHAAEMAFFAVLTLVPSTVAVGSALALLRGIVGPGAVTDAENAAVRVVRTLMGPDLSEKVIAPFIHAQLSQPKGGVAIGGLIAAWWLSSHLFMATSHALDYAYGVRDRRPTVVQRFIALGFALGSVVVVALTVELMVTGPLGDPDGAVARRLGIGPAYSVAWSILRWPVLLATVIGFLMCLYRFSPNVRQHWSDCFPGACAGAILWILAAAAFRLAASFGLHSSAGVTADDPTVAVIGQAVNAVVATVLWAYLASIAILVGSELNVQLRAERGPAAPAAPKTAGYRPY